MARPLTIVLEVGLNADAPRGIDYYVANMIEALAEVDSVNRYVIFSYFFKDYARKRDRLPRPKNPNFEFIARRFPERFVRLLDRQWRLPLIQEILLGGRRPDVYHVLGGGSLPHLRGVKSVVTFFDLAVEAFPKTGQPEPGKRIADPYTYDIARRADCLLATGQYTKSDLMRYYGVSEQKIAVIPTGVNLNVFKPVRDAETLRRARERYRLPERYLMIIGPYIPPRRANAETALRAFAELCRMGQDNGCQWVLAGSRGADLERLLAIASELGLRERIATPGYLAPEDMAAVYSQAVAVVHVTSVEGFGFGMEVLACGSPFITSNLPGVLEAVGDAALTVPPAEIPPLCEALREILTAPGLRHELSEKGLARAAKFSYRMVAERLVDLYRSLTA